MADPDRGPGTICLAITPAMKALGVKNRCRVFEIPDGIEYTMAAPRMRRYMEVSAQINGIYMRYVSPEDMHVYSIDECFIDITPYLRLYGMGAREFASFLRRKVMEETGITATAGIGTNLFLAKVALDIEAKKAADGIGFLDEESYRREIWFHHPITDIWQVGPGIARRLAKKGILDMAGVCAASPEWLRRELGKSGEYLLDHAWGQEPCTIKEIKEYRPFDLERAGAHAGLRLRRGPDRADRDGQRKLPRPVRKRAFLRERLRARGLCAADPHRGRKVGSRQRRHGQDPRAHRFTSPDTGGGVGTVRQPHVQRSLYPKAERRAGATAARQARPAEPLRRHRGRQGGKAVEGGRRREGAVREERPAQGNQPEGGGQPCGSATTR